jgi:hypothetical protein
MPDPNEPESSRPDAARPEPTPGAPFVTERPTLDAVAPDPSIPASEPAKKPIWKSWVAAGIVAAAFIGGAIAAITLTGHHGSGGNQSVQLAASNQNGQNETGGTNGGGNGTGGPNGAGGLDRFEMRGAAGTITAIDGSNLTLQARGFQGDTSPVRVVTNAETTFSETVKGRVSDLKSGDHVIVIGDRSGTSVRATNIVDNGDQALGFVGRRQGAPNGNNLPAPPDDRGNRGNGAGPGGGVFAGARFTAGTVTNVSGSTVTVKTNAGDTVTVTTTSATTVTVTKQISLTDLKVGDVVRATGSNDNGTITAERVQKGALGEFGGFGRRRHGGGESTTPTTVN